jgi:hypothetical protein
MSPALENTEIYIIFFWSVAFFNDPNRFHIGAIILAQIFEDGERFTLH